jgi:hypothetical protein
MLLPIINVSLGEPPTERGHGNYYSIAESIRRWH